MSWFDTIANDPVVTGLAETIGRGERCACRGNAGSSSTVVAAALRRQAGRPLLIVAAHLDDADEALEEIAGLGFEAARFPAMEVVPGESSINLELLAERLTLVRRVQDGAGPEIIAAPLAALMQYVPSAARLGELLRIVKVGDVIDLDEFSKWLDDAGYRRVPSIDGPGDFAVRGGIIDIYPAGAPPTRIDLFGDEIESMHEVDLATMGSDRRVESVEILGASPEQVQRDEEGVLLPTLLPEETVAVLADLAELTEQGRSYLDRVIDARGIADTPAVLKSIGEHCHAVVETNAYSSGSTGTGSALPVEPLPEFDESAAKAVVELAELARTHRTVVLGQNEGECRRIGELVTEFGEGAEVEVVEQYIHRGFIWRPNGEETALAVVPYHEMLHRYQTRRRMSRLRPGRAMDAFLDLSPGDYVVHRDHGIARFIGLQTIEQRGEGAAEEYLTLEFASEAKIHVPVSNIELVQRYVGAYKGRPELSTLGGKRWKNQKERVADAVKDLAAEMLRVQAARESLPGVRYPADTAWQREFEAEFPYEETEDQLIAMTSVKKDMSGPRPMDRLLCGDVGFGKTEVAVRAAFKAAEFGKQVAILVPTTWLAEQHGKTFRERFADYPFKVETLSRFKTGKQQQETIKGLKIGAVDVIIGTHRVLSKDVKFADLGLVIIDEEQRFGVEHKQRLLEFRATADVLTMTATPIPRTLHMAMLGLRDISSLATPPQDRRAVVTEVCSFDPERIKRGISRELAREGQVFFLHNRVNDIHDVADFVQRMAPEAKVIVGHGQMPARQLESVMRTFVRGDADILVSTTIIESGVDIPTANTMFIHDAHMFGLSELHQLRGRVGRYKHRAYCYLLIDPDKTISPEAMKRLRALENFSMLGAGFNIALRDLEIRGAGNLLGSEQSGHIAAVGYEMYCQLLEQAVGRLKNETKVSTVDTTIELGVTGTLPRGYIPSDQRRMDAYRRINQASSRESLETFRRDLESAYGSLPRSAERLMDLAEIRIAAAEIGVQTLTVTDRDLVFRTPRPRDLEERLRDARGTVRLVGQPTKDGVSTIYYRPPSQYLEPDTLLAVLRKRLAGGMVAAGV